MAYGEQTKVPLEQSIAEVIGMLRKAGAERIGQMEERDRFTVQFFMHDRMVRFRVAFPSIQDLAKSAGMRGVRPASEAELKQTREQRIKQRGRALMLVVKAKLESVESEVETFEEAFLANVVTADGSTVYERIKAPIALEYDSGKIGPLMLEGPR